MFKLNTKSIRFRVWLYMLLFTVIILLLIWFLQILFLNNFYEDMKMDRTRDAAVRIAASYKSSGINAAVSESTKTVDGDDMFIVITDSGEQVYPSQDDPAYAYELGEIDRQIRKGSDSATAFEGRITNETTQKETYYYVEVLDKSSKILPEKDKTEQSDDQGTGDRQQTGDEQPTGDAAVDEENLGSNAVIMNNRVLFVLSPLYPVTSTVAILKKQMGYIIFISLILLIFIATLMTRRISAPIMQINENARKLADGHYGINFPVTNEFSEIKALSETLNKMSNELEHSAQMQRDLMANVSHDLRTPLTMIQSYAEMVRDLSGDDPEKREAHLNVIIEESERLNGLVNDMLALTAMQSGTLSINMQPFNIYNAVDSIMAPYRVLEETEGYHVIFNCKKDIYVEGDEERIKQVVSNLLSNGVKYCGQDKTVYINIRKWGRKVHFEVVDHGVGIKADELAHIWDRYYKTSSNHVRPTRGSGLGLSIVKEILQLHGAKFGAESKVGKGTTVWFELAAAQPPSE